MSAKGSPSGSSMSWIRPPNTRCSGAPSSVHGSPPTTPLPESSVVTAAVCPSVLGAPTPTPSPESALAAVALLYLWLHIDSGTMLCALGSSSTNCISSLAKLALRRGCSLAFLRHTPLRPNPCSPSPHLRQSRSACAVTHLVLWLGCGLEYTAGHAVASHSLFSFSECPENP